MVVMEDVTEEERSAELYVSVHGGLDHTFLKRGGGRVIPFSEFKSLFSSYKRYTNHLNWGDLFR